MAQRRTRSLVAALVAVTAALSVAAALVAAAASSDAGPPGTSHEVHARKVLDVNFADPGFAKFGSHYVMYSTGARIPVAEASGPDKQFLRFPDPVMTKFPSWVSSHPLMWAPEVYAVHRGANTLYVMYFTAVSSARGEHCVGVATSNNNYLSGFVPQGAPLVCAHHPGYAAIDPAPYHAQNGTRWLIYKTAKNNDPADGIDIRALQMDSATGRYRAQHATSVSKIYSHSRMEAPSLLYHGGRVWMFLARHNWADCSYSTDVWSARYITGTFRRVRGIMSQSSLGLCGPGGASVLQDGSTTRIAFHVWRHKHPSAGVRVPWLGVLKWDSRGQPYLF